MRSHKEQGSQRKWFRSGFLISYAPLYVVFPFWLILPACYQRVPLSFASQENFEEAGGIQIVETKFCGILPSVP